MKWEPLTGIAAVGWLKAATEVGLWEIQAWSGGYHLVWYVPQSDSSARKGRYKTQGAAKGAAKRYAKKMASAFKAMGKAGWQ